MELHRSPGAKKKVVLFDDDPDRIKTWRSKLESVPGLTEECEILSPTPDEFAQVFEALKDRQTGTRNTEQTGLPSVDPEDTHDVEDRARILDEASIVIVDFDLTPRRGRSADLGYDTLKSLRGSFGDTFAYLARCYTTAGYVVLVNQIFYQSTFDLTMREFEFSAADLNITDSDLDNEGLWYGLVRQAAFRPWHWPRLLDAGAFIDDLASRIQLDDPVLETLGLDDPDVYDLFDTQQLEVLGKADARQATFRTLTEANSRFGVRSEYEEPAEPARKRIAAAALTHWLERIVIPGQNILVDAPHLAQRRPHLLLSEPTKGQFDRLADMSAPRAELGEILDLDQLAEAHTPASDWTMRPVWLWPRCPRGPITSDSLVFCEDVSYFLPIDESEEFRSELPGPFRTRFVAGDIKGKSGIPIDYRPESRLYEA